MTMSYVGALCSKQSCDHCGAGQQKLASLSSDVRLMLSKKWKLEGKSIYCMLKLK